MELVFANHVLLEHSLVLPVSAIRVSETSDCVRLSKASNRSVAALLLLRNRNRLALVGIARIAPVFEGIASGR